MKTARKTRVKIERLKQEKRVETNSRIK